MERKRVLVAYYSRTGHTRRVAEAVAKALDADVEEIRDRTDRRGIVGYLRSGLETLLGVSAEIERPHRDPADYDAVVIGSPVWASGVSTPVRTYLWLERDRLPRVAFFLTLGGMGSDRVFGQMRALSRKAPLATIAVPERDVAHRLPADLIGRFASVVAARTKPMSRRIRPRARRVQRVARAVAP